jgi:hypothetical protein
MLPFLVSNHTLHCEKKQAPFVRDVHHVGGLFFPPPTSLRPKRPPLPAAESVAQNSPAERKGEQSKPPREACTTAYTIYLSSVKTSKEAFLRGYAQGP